MILLLESDNGTPVFLTSPRDWARLKGSIITHECGSIWNHLGPTSILHIADCNIPFDHNMNVNNSVISIDDTPPLPATTIPTIPQTLPTKIY